MGRQWTKFGTCSSFGLPVINGTDAMVMKVPGIANGAGNNFGYVMNHQIAPNGGGTLVNQYTIIWDMYYPGTGTIPFFNCQNTNNVPAGLPIRVPNVGQQAAQPGGM